MTVRDLLVLLVLGALWGVAFLFLRIAVPEFGPSALMEVRVVFAAAILVPMVLARRQLTEVITHWRAIAAIGLLQYAIPFCLFAYALQTLSAGYGSVINASAPLFAGVIARLWLGERLSASRTAGLVLGLAGVVLLVQDKLVGAGEQDEIAVIACALGALCYGAAAVLARRHLAGVHSMAVAGGSLAAAAVVLLPFSIWFWPGSNPSVTSWSIAAGLGVLCTAVASILYFRLIESVGPSNAITVSFVIPVFGVAAGAVFLDEAVTVPMIVGGLVVLAGTALATGLVEPQDFWRRSRTFAARAAMLLIAMSPLGDANGAEVDTHTYLKANSFSIKREDGWDSFPTLAVSGELEVVPDRWPLVTSLFADYHVSSDDGVDGAMFAGVLVSRRTHNWDLTGYWFTSRFPGQASRATIKARWRHVAGEGRKLGLEYLSYTDALDAGELKLGYYQSYRSPLSWTVLAGYTLGAGAEPRVQVTMSYKLR